MREAVRNMSDSELADFIKRAKLEDSYLKLLNR